MNKPKRRYRKATNITLDPLVKQQSIKLASDEATTLSQLANDLLIERLTEKKMWPPSKKTDAA